MELLYYVPNLIRYLAIAATVVFLFLVWRRTRIGGFLVLTVEAAVAPLFYSLAWPLLMRLSESTAGISFISSGVSAAFALVAAAAWWNVHARLGHGLVQADATGAGPARSPYLPPAPDIEG